ncbi:hypothetical protein AGMMS50293_06900 [Spirochaetia bacterium]|nr:hypothetical protein AGMMS50293_06900 [Spirochaetia bacterium]
MNFHTLPGQPKKLTIFALCCVFFSLSSLVHAGASKERLHESPAPESAAPAIEPAAEPRRRLLIGADTGLFSIERPGETTALWTGGQVRKIVSPDDSGVWAILGSEGILVSNDMRNWESRNQGLPIKTIKIFQDGKKSFLSMVQEIKDLEMNPANPDIMVCATKDRVYLSRNQGLSWSSLGAPSYRTNGIKAVAVAYLPVVGNGGTGRSGAASSGAASSDAASSIAASSGGVLTVFLSHSTYGLFYIQPDSAGAQWIEINSGLEKLETTDNTDEVSDIAVTAGISTLDANVPAANVAALSAGQEIYVSQTFRRRIYRLDWSRKTFNLIWSDNAPFGTVDSLDAGKTSLRFLYEGTTAEIDYPAANGVQAANGTAAAPGQNAQMRNRPDLLEAIRSIPESPQLKPNCVVLWENRNGAEPVKLSELWLLNEGDSAPATPASPAISALATPASPAISALAAGKEGLYLPVNHAMDSNSLKPYLDVISERGLDMIVIDMKDDYGRLRFTPRNSAISEKGRVFRPLDIDALLRNFKSRGIYTVARVVVFKDPELAAKDGGKYAVWDSKNNKPWVGYYDSRRKKSAISEEDRQNALITFLPADDPEYEIVRTFYDERWVDPYSEEVWEYTAAVAAELHGRGFDEIQFDYIRFPTDGANLGDARYRWQENSMDMESAMLSFLRHIRSRVNAPISIDIYGANGWYRTGARTGQEVELLAPWVDVICPMYYPSHFEQDFLAQDPPELRPYRIYFQGTQRTARIGRGQIIVRPYVQAFYLNVSYDRKYYDLEYVRREVEGVRDAGRPGFTYWNNSGRYADIPF